MTLYGCDVSNEQGAGVNWDAVKAEGVSFAICKRSEGTGYVDPTFDRNWSELGRLEMGRGAYHFARPDRGTNPVDEAHYFLNRLPSLVAGDMVVLDMELPTDLSQAPAHLSWWALTWLQAVEAIVGFPPLIYSYPYYTQRNLNDAALARYPLWLAAYDGAVPASISVWSSVAIWQNSSSGSLNGISGQVDLDRLERTLDGLRQLGKPAPAPAARYQVMVKMMARFAPNVTAVRVPIQWLGKNAVLDGTGRVQNGWIEVIAGGHPVWALGKNLNRL
jgi:GH25 family lysozyme M1 (1,4-beta-N-acetylmuramidase)